MKIIGPKYRMNRRGDYWYVLERKLLIFYFPVHRFYGLSSGYKEARRLFCRLTLAEKQSRE